MYEWPIDRLVWVEVHRKWVSVSFPRAFCFRITYQRSHCMPKKPKTHTCGSKTANALFALPFLSIMIASKIYWYNESELGLAPIECQHTHGENGSWKGESKRHIYHDRLSRRNQKILRHFQMRITIILGHLQNTLCYENKTNCYCISDTDGRIKDRDGCAGWLDFFLANFAFIKSHLTLFVPYPPPFTFLQIEMNWHDACDPLSIPSVASGP